MSVTIESLELEIQSTSSSAVNGIDALTASLLKLKTALKGGVGLAQANNQLKSLSATLQNLNPGAASKLTKISDGLKGFQNLKISPSINNQLKNISSTASVLNSTDFTGVEKLGVALQAFTNLKKISLRTFVNNLPKLAQVMRDLDVDELDEKFQRLNSTLKPISDTLKGLNQSFVGLPTNMRRFLSAANQVSRSNQKQSLSWKDMLLKIGASSIALIKSGQTVASWIHNTNSYIENVNLFTASMGKYADEAQKYAEQVGEIMGIDPGEFMRNQGVFMTIIEGFGVINDRAYIMSKNLTQLGYDLSSFFNIGFDDAMEKLTSGISGELEPLRRLGYDLSQARLEAIALSLGIDKSFDSMTQAEKSQLRYYAIMKQVTVAQGDMARSLNAPANQMRVLQAQVTQCARALGSIFIPALNAILPYAIALIKVLRKLAEVIASFVGFELPQIDYSGISSGSSAAGDLADNLGDASNKAKKLQNHLLGIDELNILTENDGSASGNGNSLGLGGGDLGFELPQYDFLGDAISTRIDQAAEAIKKLIPLIIAVGTAFATWKFANWMAGLLGVKNLLSLLTGKDYFGILAGMVLSVGGAILYLSGAYDALKNGIDAKNLIEMLSGIAMMASGLYLAIKPFSSDLALVAAGFTAVASGLGLFNISLHEIESNGTSLTNLVGAFSGLTAAVVGFEIAFKKSKLAITSVIAPMTAFMGSLQIVKATFVDIIMNGADFANVFGLISGGVAAVVAAVWLWNEACAVNPILAIGMIVAGIVISIASIAKAINDAGEAAYESTDDFKVMEAIIERSSEVSERCATAIDTMKTNVDSLNRVGEDFAMASTLVSEIYAINENVDATNYDLELMAVKVDILNGLGIDGLSLSIDETTGRVVQARGEVENLIASLQQEARMEAMRELLVQTYKDQFTAMSDAKRALQDYDAASSALNETAEKLADCPWYDFKTHSQLTAAQKEQTKAVEAAQKAYSDSMDTYDQLSGVLSTYTDEIIDLKKQEIGVGDEMVKGLDTVKSSLDDTASSMTGYGKNIAEGLRNGVTENVKENEYRSIWQKIGDWFTELFGIHSPSTVFAGYGKNIVDGLNNGLADNSVRSEGVIRTWVSQIKNWFSHGSSGEGINRVTFARFASDMTSGFNEGVDVSYPDGKTNITTWANKLKEWFTNSSFGAVNANTFATFASYVIEGFKGKIGSAYTDTRSNMTTWANDTNRWFSEIASNSAFARFALEIINGFKNKISSDYALAEPSMARFANAVKDRFEKPDGETLVSKFTHIGANIIQGFIDGVNSLWDKAMKRIREFGESIIGEGEDATEEHSPSRAFKRIGAFVIEGFNIGLESQIGTSFRIMDDWLTGINSYTPQLAVSVDTSAFDRFDPYSAYYMTSTDISTDFHQAVDIDHSEMREVMREAMLEALNDSNLASDMKRQADKSEQTIVQVGNRTVTDAVVTQQEANGYRFTT